ncbi:DNA adenine methylase [Chryseobacterium vietnamense]|uniref:DNA adenine methylase n=1 Tax=Chryseobacterium vietnamense TaxID=866785 RepID=A0ACC6J820_9FLAO|nr:Dam family site-specific DNA-(adenine-N6)-methyltransferase [Chryseobacterium vietnamense]MDR6458967.1 DNA adenine methylase [Chryseobacterium vietnamense]
MSQKKNVGKEKKINPFLRWAGGKRWFLKELDKLVTIENFGNYHEPFVGGGSVYFHFNPQNAIISDSNEELINTYINVRDNIDDVIIFLKEFKNTEEFYYSIRKTKFNDEIMEAAKFIYLNQTSFNGIFRVNSKGEYNVPYGHRDKYKFDYENLCEVNISLQGTVVECCDFDSSIENIQKGDLVFLDPPYTVAHNNNGFIQYNQKIFSLEDQYRLAKFINELKEIGAFYIMTNAAHNSIKDIFNNGDRMFELNRSSLIGGRNAIRGKYSELILTNLL